MDTLMDLLGMLLAMAAMVVGAFMTLGGVVGVVMAMNGHDNDGDRLKGWQLWTCLLLGVPLIWMGGFWFEALR